MKAQLVKENISDFLKPKSKEDLLKDPIYKKVNKFMSEIFSNLHKSNKTTNIYRNSKGEWVFKHDLKNKCIWVNYSRVWIYFQINLYLNHHTIAMLIESWLKEHTDWPELQVFVCGNKIPNY